MIQITFSRMLKTMAVAVLLSTAVVSATRVSAGRNDDGFSPQKMRNLGKGKGKLGYILKSSKSSKKKKSEEPSAVPSAAPTSGPTKAPTSSPTEAPTSSPTDYEAPTSSPTGYEAPTSSPTAYYE